MLDWVFNRAGSAAQDAVRELVFTVAAVLLACGAVFFFGAGLVVWLATMMEMQFALIIVAALLCVLAATILLLTHRERGGKTNNSLAQISAAAPAIERAASAIPASLRIAASSLVASQLRRAPLATLGVIAAVVAFSAVSSDVAEESP